MDRADDLPWKDLGAGKSAPLAGIDLVSTRYRIEYTTDVHVVLVRRRSDNAIIVRHQTGRPDYVTVFADVAGDMLVIADEDDETGDGVKEPAHSYIYNLRTAGRTRLNDIPTAPAPSEFGRQATVTDDGRYYYSAASPTKGIAGPRCVAMLNLNTMHGAMVECGGDQSTEFDGYYVAAADNGATWLHAQGPNLESCRTGHGVYGTKLFIVGPPAACATLGTTRVGDWSVWSATVVAAGGLVPYIPLHATDGTHTVELGDINGVALTMCGQYAYWRTTNRGTETIQLRRWRPGLRNLEIAYKVVAPGDVSAAYQIGLGGCADNIFTVQVFTVDVPKGVSDIRVLTLES